MWSVDFSVIGFPKCGTSALIDMLAASPALNVTGTERRMDETGAKRLRGRFPVAPAPGDTRPNGHKVAAYIYNPHRMKAMMDQNPNVLFAITVRPAGEALLSWYDMHRTIARGEGRKHFAAATEEARAFFGECSEKEYFDTFARSRLKHADQLRQLFDVAPGLNYLIVSQARLSRDARGVMRDIHDRLGVSSPGAYYESLPAGHQARGVRDLSARISDPELIRELRESDEDLLGVLRGLEPSRVMLSGAAGF